LDGLLAGTAIAFALALTVYSKDTFAQSSATAPDPALPQVTADPPTPVDDLSPQTLANESAAKPAMPAAEAAAATTPAAKSDMPPAGAAMATTAAPEPATPATAIAPAAAPSEITSTVPSSGSQTPGSNASVAERLREQLAAGKFDRILGGKKERSSVEAFYGSREFAPLWISDGALSERGKEAAAYLARVDADGLDPADYPLPAIKADAEPDALAEAEIKFTDSALTFARHAQTGRVHFSRVASDILYTLVKSEPNEVLGKLASAGKVGEALDSFNPQQPGYKALKAKLAEARHGSDVAKPMIPQGPVLKYSRDKKGKEVLMEDPRVPALRKWFGMKSPDGDTKYDKALADTIAKFQKEHSLQANGHLTASTLDALNGPKRERTVDIILVNMERWRWLPRDLGDIYVMVNIPDYSLRVVKDNKLVWATKIVVGKPNLATPITSAEMKYITVNPTWNVPPSIIQNEYLPVLAQDPQALERIGLRVDQDRDGNIRIWQPPGERNALGRLRFNFPNKFLVYQHDTPDKHLFAHEKRAYSHGCMRVQDPVKYGEVLLSLVMPKEKYTQERLRGMFGSSEININFPTTIPVHLTYQTAFVNDAGNLQIRDDVYGRDARMLALMKGSERKVADIAVDRPKNNSSAPVRLPPGTYGSSGGFGFGGGGFFDRLFGGYDPPPMRPRARVGRAHDRWNFR
jgi:murein L,D-transpeptidase YcbB/YkuD